MFEKQLKQLEILEPLINQINNQEITLDYNFLYERIKHPSTYLVFMGKTSSGKSSIINGLLGDEILPVSTAPTTARLTEIVLTNEIKDNKYYRFTTKLKKESLCFEEFLEESRNPSEETSRFSILIKSNVDRLKNLSIFDTPGYGSADFKNHDKILEDFLPNSDIIVFVVPYIGGGGLGVMDLPYLGYSANLLKHETETILLINRCPETIDENNKRIREIKEIFQEHTGFSPKLFFVKDLADGNTSHPMPKCLDLWEYIIASLNTKDRIAMLNTAFDNHFSFLFQRCKNEINSSYSRDNAPVDVYKKTYEEVIITANNIRNLITKEIEPTYISLLDALPRLYEKAANEIISGIQKNIDTVENTKMDETKAFILSHQLPFLTRQETKKIQKYCDEILKALNLRCRDYINKELENFNDKVYVIVGSYTEDAVKNLGQNIMQNAITSYIEKYLIKKSTEPFIKQEIMGITNQFATKAVGQFATKTTQQVAVKSMNSVVSNFVKQSSDDILRSTLSQIGANAMKAINIGIATVIELFTLGIDLATWKSKLSKAVDKGVNSWKLESLPSTIDNIKKSKELNKQNIQEIADEWENNIKPGKTKNVLDYEKLFNILKETENQLGGIKCQDLKL